MDFIRLVAVCYTSQNSFKLNSGGENARAEYLQILAEIGNLPDGMSFGQVQSAARNIAKRHGFVIVRP